MDDGDEVVIVGMQYNSLGGGTSSTTSKAAGHNSSTRPMLKKQASFSSLSDTPTPKQTATRLLGLALDAQHEDKVWHSCDHIGFLSHTSFKNPPC